MGGEAWCGCRHPCSVASSAFSTHAVVPCRGGVRSFAEEVPDFFQPGENLSLCAGSVACRYLRPRGGSRLSSLPGRLEHHHHVDLSGLSGGGHPLRRMEVPPPAPAATPAPRRRPEYQIGGLPWQSQSKLSPVGTAEHFPGFRRGLFPAVPAGLVVLSNPTQDWRPGLNSAVPAGLSFEIESSHVLKFILHWRRHLQFSAVSSKPVNLSGATRESPSAESVPNSACYSTRRP